MTVNKGFSCYFSQANDRHCSRPLRARGQRGRSALSSAARSWSLSPAGRPGWFVSPGMPSAPNRLHPGRPSARCAHRQASPSPALGFPDGKRDFDCACLTALLGIREMKAFSQGFSASAPLTSGAWQFFAVGPSCLL